MTKKFPPDRLSPDLRSLMRTLDAYDKANPDAKVRQVVDEMDRRHQRELIVRGRIIAALGVLLLVAIVAIIALAQP